MRAVNRLTKANTKDIIVRKTREYGMKVVSKQNNSKMCMICGLENPAGLKASFYNMTDQSVCTRFMYRDIHQSYPDRVHGGLIACMLDELAGRVLWVTDPDLFAVTMRLNNVYRKPVRYNETVYGRGVIKERAKRGFNAECAIYSEKGDVLAQCSAEYLFVPLDKIGVDDVHNINIFVPDDVKSIDFFDDNGKPIA